MRRLTDDELRALYRRRDQEFTGEAHLTSDELTALLDELLAIRSKMLTDEEGTALERLAECMRGLSDTFSTRESELALSAINKLLGIERKEQG